MKRRTLHAAVVSTLMQLYMTNPATAAATTREPIGMGDPDSGRPPVLGRDDPRNLQPGPGTETIPLPIASAKKSGQATSWVRADRFNHAIWYSLDDSGTPQCYSIDGLKCLPSDSAAPTSPEIAITPDVISAMGDAATAKQFLAVHRSINLHFRAQPGAIQVVPPDNAGPAYEVIEPVNAIVHPEVRQIVLPDDADEGVSVYVLNDVEQTRILSSMGLMKKVLRKDQRGAWVFKAGRWIDISDDFDPNSQDNRKLAQPVNCSHSPTGLPPTGLGIDPIAPDPRVMGVVQQPWCEQLLSLDAKLRQADTQSLYERKLAHMDELFEQHEDWAVAKAEENGHYKPRISDLSQQYEGKSMAAKISCGFVLFPPGAIACGIQQSQAKDLKAELDALTEEQKSKLASARAAVSERRQADWHRLHETWAASDRSHFAGLLRVESKELDELRQLKDAYDKNAEEKHQAYLDAAKQYEHDSGLLGVAEHLPLVGAEIRHIEDYAEHPNKQNLRRMLLGAFGPIGENTEGVVELTTGGSGIDSDKTHFLMDVLKDLKEKKSFSDAMEAIVADSVRDLGDDAIEGIREAGMWSAKGDGETPLTLSYQNLAELRLKTTRVLYDPWLDQSNPAVRNFQLKFVPAKREYESYIGGHFTYDPASSAQIENASGAAAFAHHLETVFVHSMGPDYDRIVKKNPTYANWNRTQVNEELYKVIADPAYLEQRQARWVNSEVLGGRPAGLLYDNDHAVIVLNSDILKEDQPDLGKFYLEELGHLLNWWRCKLFDVDVAQCALIGDGGARFRDAVLVDPSQYNEPFETLLADLPSHNDSDKSVVALGNGNSAWIEGWPDYYTLNDHIIGGGKFSFLIRGGLDLTNKEYSGVSDEFDVEVVIAAPSKSKLGNPWAVSDKGYCSHATYQADAPNTDCNVPTMWVSIAFRDAIKFSLANAPKVKNTSFKDSGVDLSPRLVRKHGAKLAFQPRPGAPGEWRAMPDHTIYSKKFSLGLEAKLDAAKMFQTVSDKRLPKGNKLEVSGKGQVEGSYLVEIPTSDQDLFHKWLALDITSAVLGCAGGFVFAAVTEEDPVTMCHAFSDMTEGVETAMQLMDNKPTALFEADTSVAVPLSVEYKHVLKQKPDAPAATPSPGTASSPSRVWRVGDGPDRGSHVAELQELPSPQPSLPETSPANVPAHPQAEKLKTQVRGALSKMGDLPQRTDMLLVFRPRIGWDLGEKILSKGTYNLPSLIVEE